VKKLGIVLLSLFVIGLVGSLFDGSSGQESSSASDATAAVTIPRLPTTTVQATTTTTQPAVTSKQFKAALSKTSVKKDEVAGKSWYRAKSSPAYVNQNGFFLYIGQDEGSDPYFRFRIQYYGEEWLFIDSFLINVDGAKYEISTSYGEVERDNDAEVWEWYDVSPSITDLTMLAKISESKKTVVRMIGSQYHKDVVLTSAQKQAINTMLTVYQGLGGVLTTL
jgi:hypothetical protein